MSPSHLLLRLMPPLLLLLISFNLPTAMSAAPCNPNDKRALLQLKAALGHPRTLLTWTADTDCCTQWSAITGCDSGTGRVTTLHIAESDAAGSLPPSIGDLPYLDALTISWSPNLTGPLPPELTKLTKLQTLSLDGNSLTGPVPAFLGRMPRLSYINLSNNKLSGFIPPSLGHLPELMALYLDHNRLRGGIPASLGRLRRPTGFYIGLSHNRLTGPVPPSFGNLNIIRVKNTEEHTESREKDTKRRMEQRQMGRMARTVRCAAIERMAHIYSTEVVTKKFPEVLRVATLG